MSDAQFTQVFRGYDREQVDAELARMREQIEQSRRSAVAARQDVDAELSHLREDMASAERRITDLMDQLAEANARLANAESRAETLGAEALAGDDENPARFHEILRVAEEQAQTLIDNASGQSERMIQDAKEQAEKVRADAQAEAERILSNAKHEEQQSRIRIDTERSAHEAELEERGALVGQKTQQAESEARVLVAEAERAASALRAQVTSETDDQKAEAERLLRDAKNRQLELEAAVRRREEEAQQEYLRLHEQAIAHAERITADANEKVQSALLHASHITSQSDAFQELARAQARHVEADAASRANAMMTEAQKRSQVIIDKVLEHSREMLRDAEDRQRTLRFQQQQITGFVAEVQQLMALAGQARFPEQPGTETDSDVEVVEAEVFGADVPEDELEDDRDQVTEVEVTFAEAEVLSEATEPPATDDEAR